MTTPARRRPARSRRPATATSAGPADLWQTKPTPAQPEMIVPAADPAALVNSLGPAPLPGHGARADGYVTAVVERAAALATALKFVSERVVRREMADYLAVRQRPGTSQPGAILRGDVPASGPAFPSGHVILVAAIGSVVAPSLESGWAVVPVVLTLLVMVGRVYVGAHNPLDVTAGAGAGMLLGGVLATFVR